MKKEIIVRFSFMLLLFILVYSFLDPHPEALSGMAVQQTQTESEVQEQLSRDATAEFRPFYGAISHNDFSSLAVRLENTHPDEIRSISYFLNGQEKFPLDYDVIATLNPDGSTLVTLTGELLHLYPEGRHVFEVRHYLRNGETVSARGQFAVDHRAPTINVVSASPDQRDFVVEVLDMYLFGAKVIANNDYVQDAIISRDENPGVHTYTLRIPGSLDNSEVIFVAWDTSHNTFSIVLREGEQGTSSSITGGGTSPLEDTCGPVKVRIVYTTSDIPPASGHFFDEWYGQGARQAKLYRAFDSAKSIIKQTAGVDLFLEGVYYISPTQLAQKIPGLTTQQMTIRFVNPDQPSQSTYPPYTQTLTFSGTQTQEFKIKIYTELKINGYGQGNVDTNTLFVFVLDRYSEIPVAIDGVTNYNWGVTILQYLNFLTVPRTKPTYAGTTVTLPGDGTFQDVRLNHALAHELLHQLGLGHDTETGPLALMWPINVVNPAQTKIHEIHKKRARSAGCVTGFEHGKGEWANHPAQGGSFSNIGCYDSGLSRESGIDPFTGQQGAPVHLEECEVKWGDYFKKDFVKKKGNPHVPGDNTPSGEHPVGTFQWCPYTSPQGEIIALHPQKARELCYNSQGQITDQCKICTPPAGAFSLPPGLEQCHCYTRQQLKDGRIPEERLPPPSIGPPDGGGGGPGTGGGGRGGGGNPQTCEETKPESRWRQSQPPGNPAPDWRPELVKEWFCDPDVECPISAAGEEQNCEPVPDSATGDLKCTCVEQRGDEGEPELATPTTYSL